MRIVQDTAAASFAGWTIDEIDIFLQHEKVRATVEHLDTDFAEVHNQASGHADLQPELMVLKRPFLRSTLGRGRSSGTSSSFSVIMRWSLNNLPRLKTRSRTASLVLGRWRLLSLALGLR